MHAPVIVYVEDNSGDVLLLRQAFEEHCFNVEVEVIPDGSQALRYLMVKSTARDAPPPDMILLDLRLPKIDGSELWKFIVEDDYLRGIPAYLFDLSKSPSLGSAPLDRRLEKPSTWDGYLTLTRQLIDLIEAHRRAKSVRPG